MRIFRYTYTVYLSVNAGTELVNEQTAAQTNKQITANVNKLIVGNVISKLKTNS